jgi:hypothetical protein
MHVFEADDSLAPSGLALDAPRSTLFVTHDETHCVQAWRVQYPGDPVQVASATAADTGTPSVWSKVWEYGVRGEPGGGATQLNFPSGCAHDDYNGELFVVDSANHRVVVVRASNGKFVREFGHFGPDADGFHFPRFIAVATHTLDAIDDSGTVHPPVRPRASSVFSSPVVMKARVPVLVAVSDMDMRVRVHSGMGLPLLLLSSSFIYPTGLAFHGRKLYVADSGNQCIQVVDINSVGDTYSDHVVRSLPLTGLIAGEDEEAARAYGSLSLSLDSARSLLCVGQENNRRLAVMSVDDSLTSSSVAESTLIIGGPQRFQHPVDVQVDASRGVIFVADCSQQHVQMWRL